MLYHCNVSDALHLKLVCVDTGIAFRMLSRTTFCGPFFPDFAHKETHRTLISCVSTLLAATDAADFTLLSLLNLDNAQ